jgi:2-oxoglutarate ferredoxin oxidoreductase subunit beta
MQPKSLPAPNLHEGVNPLAMALAAGYTFIARSYAFDAKHLRATICAAVRHRGMALVDILQPCPTYNDLHDKEYFAELVEVEGKRQPRIYRIEDEGYDGVVHDPADEREIRRKQRQAFDQVMRHEERAAIGVFYQVRVPTFDERLAEAVPALRDASPAAARIADDDGRPATDIASLVREFSV